MTENQKPNNQELLAMISLLDDEDETVYESLLSHFLEIGKPAIPLLEEKWSQSLDALLQTRIENIVHKIQFEAVKSELTNWKEHNQKNLLSGLITIARYQYPDLDEDSINVFFSEVRRRVWDDLQPNDTPLEQVRILNQVLFVEFGFNGNTANFHSPQNSFINTVIESKRGNPILLSVIYAIVAQDLDIPVYGVNLPEHFVLCYQTLHKDKFAEYAFPEDNILFFINAFSRGSVFGKDEIDLYLRKLKLPSDKKFITPCSNTDIIRRILHNLNFSFNKSGLTEKSEEIEILLALLEK
ncbi:MAG TPA: transglutaminase-like domain-containing protein [Bacteroidia bacterium]|nr:transglutaminase-like domain-containing protein [Bacteroidia bacterium]HRF16086.1 transglutaminase-like domain-containing protein [Bacteroidia bacterium]